MYVIHTELKDKNSVMLAQINDIFKSHFLSKVSIILGYMLNNSIKDRKYINALPDKGYLSPQRSGREMNQLGKRICHIAISSSRNFTLIHPEINPMFTDENSTRNCLE
jgi:hypothetical protein